DLNLWTNTHPSAIALIGVFWAVAINRILQAWDSGWKAWLRHGVLLSIAVYALYPYVNMNFVGSGDARDYVLHVQDFVTQLRAGIWPIFVGQSDYAFTGGIHTLRTAPGYVHVAGILDLATLHRLPLLAVQKLTLMASATGAVFAMYVAVTRIMGARRAWLAVMLSAIYILSPGALTPIYVSDMYATFMVLPWLPLLFLGLIELAEGVNTGTWFWGAATGGLWWTHAPTATWAMLLSAAVLLLSGRPRNLADIRHLVMGLLVAGALSVYVFVSVKTLELVEAFGPSVAIKDFIIKTGMAYRELLGPALVANGGDIKLGWQLGLAVIACWFCTSVACLRVPVARALFLCGIWLVLLLGVWSMASKLLWTLIPNFVVGATGNWPQQRLVGLLCAGGVIGAALSLRTFVDSGKRSFIAASLFFIAAVGWSAWEVQKFHLRAKAISVPADTTAGMLSAETVTIGRSSYEILSCLPDYFSHGRIDPALEFRLVDLKSGLAYADGATQGKLTSALGKSQDLIINGPGLELTSHVMLPARGALLLRFDFLGEQPEGVLQIKGRRFCLEYSLPLSGKPRSFGSGPLARPVLLVRNPESEDDPLLFIFWPKNSAKFIEGHIFARLQADAWPIEHSPVRIRGLLPASIDVDASESGWLESPKLWIPGYEARVDHEPVKVVKSREGLVAVPVPQGTHSVEIYYRGPISLRLAYLFSITAWIAVIGTFLWKTARRRINRVSTPHIDIGAIQEGTVPSFSRLG
ncbi:MAG TPA: hypothetical protein VKC60_11850, partial [Opitutaceae bacterium]|nr:hypothetical protein [Opitutaceae bacterium]